MKKPKTYKLTDEHLIELNDSYRALGKTIEDLSKRRLIISEKIIKRANEIYPKEEDCDRITFDNKDKKITFHF